jgi:riboflavin synthase
MFTGLIESLGEVLEVKPIAAGFRMRVRAGIGGDLLEGESVAVNGVCLTAVETSSGELRAEIGPETARVTTLGRLKPGALVNLERAVRADGRLGGHFVLGHVDGTGIIQRVRPEADFYWVTIGYPGLLAAYLIHRGSIAVDGVSLTIAALRPSSPPSFDVQIVPHTWRHTNLQAVDVETAVNLECDMIGKYVARAMEVMGKVSV